MERILLIETSTALCSTALAEDGVITAYRESSAPKAHASLTAVFVQEMLAERGITLSDNEHLVTVNGEKVVLTFKEFEILKLFMSNPGIVFSRDKLLSEVWGVDYLGESRTVDMHIKTLRQKLGDVGSRIETVIGVGYKMEGKK